MDEEWKNDPIYKRLIMYIDTRIQFRANMVFFLASSLGIVYLNPVLPCIVVWGIAFRNILIQIKKYLFDRNSLTFRLVITKMELHEDGHNVTVHFSNRFWIS